MRTFRVRYKHLGGHIHCRVFSAENPSGTFAKLGDLTLDERDWESFRAQVGNGWQFIDDKQAAQLEVAHITGTIDRIFGRNDKPCQECGAMFYHTDTCSRGATPLCPECGRGDTTHTDACSQGRD